MKSEEMCERIATHMMQEYVNQCRPDNKEDIIKALHKMIAVSLSAIDLVQNGKAETVQ